MQSSPSEQQINDTIRRVWYHLTDREIGARQEYRDIFFLAVRKKHGVTRAQAEIFLHSLEQQLREAA